MPWKHIFRSEEIRRTHELLQAEFKKRPGSVRRTTKKIGVGPDFFQQSRKRRTLDHGVLLETLYQLEIEPMDFFRQLHDEPNDGRSAERPEERKSAGSPAKGGAKLNFAPADPDLAASLDPWLDEMDELRYDDFEAALAQLRERAHAIPRDAGARFLAVAASCLRMAGDLGYAGFCLEGAMAIAPSDLVRGEVLQRKSYVVWNLGDVDGALELVERAAGIFGRIDARRRFGQALVDQGNLLWHLGKVSAAIGSMETASRFVPGDRFPRTWCVIHQVVALCHSHNGRASAAYEEIRRARDLAPDRHMRARALGVEATLMEGMQRWAGAARAYEAAFDLLDEPLERLICLAYLVRTRALAGSPSGALEAAQSAVNLMGAVKGKVGQAAILELYKLTAADCARRSVVDGVIDKLSGLAAASRTSDTLGDRLRRARQRLGVKRQVIALELDIAEVSLQKIESGATPGNLYQDRIGGWIETASVEMQLARSAFSAV